MPLQFMTSLTPIEILNKEVQIQLHINGEFIGLVGPDQYEITLRTMINNCHLGFKTNTGDFA